MPLFTGLQKISGLNSLTMISLFPPNAGYAFLGEGESHIALLYWLRQTPNVSKVSDLRLRPPKLQMLPSTTNSFGQSANVWPVKNALEADFIYDAQLEYLRR